MKTYVGTVSQGELNWSVRVEQDKGQPVYPLDPGYKYVNHSPDGFAWGYGGSGPAQLAFAILLDATRSSERALRSYQEFKRAVIAALDGDYGFRLPIDVVLRNLAEIERRAA